MTQSPQFSRIRVEEAGTPILEPESRDVEYWRRMAVQAGERLAYAEQQLKDLRGAADDARARMAKYAKRLDGANERVNDLQAELISVSAERDQLRERESAELRELRERVARQEIVKRKVHEYRQSLLDGPIWELFAEL